MENKVLLVLLVLCYHIGCTVGGYFTIVGPRTVQRGNKYSVYLTFIDYHDTEIIKVALTGLKSDEELSNEVTLGLMEDEKEKKLTFDISGDTFSQNYNLTVSIAGEKFVQSTEIISIQKRYSVFIQTDRAFYRPGATVQYRVVVLDAETKPFKVVRIRIEISDSSGNLFSKIEEPEGDKVFDEKPGKQKPEPKSSEEDNDDEESEETTTKKTFRKPGKPVVKEDKFKKGFYNNTFVIDEETLLGTWTIKVRINDDDDIVTTQPFQVEEYVLPRFKVIVDTKPHVTLDEGSIKVGVSAIYTFNEFVEGSAKVTANVYDTGHPTLLQKTVSKSADNVNFKKTLDFNIKKDLGVYNTIRAFQVDFKVEYTEKLTGQKLEGKSSVRIHEHGDVTLDLIRVEKKFKPGYPFNLKAIVRKYDGSLESNRITPVLLRIKYFFSPLMCSSKSKIDSLINSVETNKENLLSGGIAAFEIEVPQNTTAMSITAKYLYAKSSLNVTRFVSNTREYLFVSLRTTPNLGKKLKVLVKGSLIDRQDIHSIVIGRTGIVHRDMHEYADGSAKFSIKTNSGMVPSSTLIVYYIQLTGEIIYDMIPLKFETELPNELDITLSTNLTRPGSSCKLKVTSAPDSIVSLLGVDESSTLLGTGNDIDETRVRTDMAGFIAKNLPDLVIKGNTNRYLDFGESTAFIITNALEGKISCIDERLSPRVDDPVEDDTDDSDLVDSVDPDPNKPRIRKDFRETWIFEDIKVKADGTASLTKRVPDTITSFIVSGFSISPEYGLGIATPQKITIFQDFFIKLFLPYSIRFGEVLKVDVTVFNYIPKPKKAVNAEITMWNKNDEFEFIEPTSSGKNCLYNPVQEKSKSKTVKVETGTGGATFFHIRALITGEIKIKIKATSGKYGDEVEMPLRVENEGLTHYRNEAKLFDLTKVPRNSFLFEIKIPSTNIIHRSINIEASVMGDLLGPVMRNIQNLIRMPGGCNEQTFHSWIPNIVAMKYLDTIGELTQAQRDSGKTYLQAGNQKLLNLKNDRDGSFNLYKSHTWVKQTAYEPNVWLTAYVAKLLAFSKEFYSLNDKLIVDALIFLKKSQNADGSFTSAGLSYDFTTRSGQGVALTAFVAIAFIQNKEYAPQYKDVINKALNNINEKIGSLQDNYEIAIASYALSLAKHEAKDNFIDELKKNAISHDNKMYWYREVKSSVNAGPASVNVEIAAYALMAFVNAGLEVEAVQIMNWLITQRTSTGGFHTTTDTVIGIEALTVIASKLYSPDVKIDVKLSLKPSSEQEHEKNFKINKQNALEVQYKELPKATKSASCNVNGKGFAYVQVAYQYNTVIQDPVRKFDLTVAVQSTTPSVLTLEICAKYLPEGEQKKTGMTLMEIFLPSGYVYDPETVNLVKAAGVRRTETKNHKTIIVLYFDTFSDIQVCTKVKAIRQSIVTDPKQSVVKIYEYTDSGNNRASAFYLPTSDKTCGF